MEYYYCSDHSGKQQILTSYLHVFLRTAEDTLLLALLSELQGKGWGRAGKLRGKAGRVVCLLLWGSEGKILWESLELDNLQEMRGSAYGDEDDAGCVSDSGDAVRRGWAD